VILPLTLCRINLPPFGPEVPVVKQLASATSFLTPASAADPLAIATAFLDERVPLVGGFSYVVKDQYRTDSSGVTHVYARQTVHGVEIVNADVNINVDVYGRVLSFYSSFYQGPAPEQSTTNTGNSNNNNQQVLAGTVKSDDGVISPAEAVVEFAKFLKLSQIPQVDALQETPALQVSPGISAEGEPGVTVSQVPFTADSKVVMAQRYLIVSGPDGQLSLVPVWDMVVDMADGDNWYNVQMDIRSGQVHQMIDWVAEARYNVYPIGVNDPDDGQRQLVVDPADLVASPKGWHDQAKAGRGRGPNGDGKFTSTIGNNVFAQANPDGRNGFENNFRPDGGRSLEFNHSLNLTQDPSKYINASITNLFYWNNIMHDVFYRYGFDEKSGNFQEDNFGRGGRGGDAVIANAQDGSGYNNANFATPPDGQRGRMRMYVWTTSNPRRDGDLEAGIIIHEYAHGISNRLTGGPMNSNCLGFGESGGMGEGWGDAFGTALRMRSYYTNQTNFAMGLYSAGRGIRPFPYSTSLETNPQLYSTTKKPGYGGVHAIGSVWATMLYELYWALTDKHGFTPDWYSIKNLASEKMAGNVQFLKLVVDGMKLQPCRPSFINARDAILQADETNFAGENTCLIWKAFAKRGLGYDARPRGVDGFAVPPACL